ncbi:MAG: hypothetical protein E7547_04535 [Ruminococcaceae bacterium]|nr:hypothetical protein [Oscillospiraceae bacterium]
MKKIISVLLVAVTVFAAGAAYTKTQESEIPLAYESNSVETIENMEMQMSNAVEKAYDANNSGADFADAFGYVIVNVTSDGSEDVADEIQNIIDSNPNRTIYFPDGVYLISKPICTPANPRKSVDLQLSNYAVIKAADSWSDDEAMIRLGGKDAANDTHTAGSNYSLNGGVIDGSGKADAVSIDSGRETRISNLSIKNAVLGIHIKYGANSGSSDADISDVNIIGTGGTDSTGIFIEGFDNTLTNIRIGNVFIGVHLKSSANSMRNIHPLYYSDYTDFENSCGFYDESGNNIYDFCYSDQFCNGFRMKGNISNIYHNCFCFWYSNAGGKEVAFKVDGLFESVVTNFRAGFRSDTENAVLEADKFGGNGVFDNLLVNGKIVADKSYKFYKEGTLWWFINCIIK